MVGCTLVDYANLSLFSSLRFDRHSLGKICLLNYISDIFVRQVSLLVATSVPAISIPHRSISKTRILSQPMKLLTMSVAGFRSRDIICSDFSHTPSVLRAIYVSV